MFTAQIGPALRTEPFCQICKHKAQYQIKPTGLNRKEGGVGGSCTTLDVNSISNPLPPPLPIPPLLTDGQTRKKQAHGWMPIRQREERIAFRQKDRKEEKWATETQFAASFTCSHPAAKIEHSGVENCETLTLEILFSHFEKGRGYNLKPSTILRSKNIGEQTPGGPWTVISPQLAKCPPADVLIHISLPPCPLKVHSSTSVCVLLCTNIP